MTCDTCGNDYAPFPDCDCVRRNQPVQPWEWRNMVIGFGALALFILWNFGLLPWW